MSLLLDRSPFSDQAGEVVVRGERVRVRANQIILWVSLTPRRVTAPNPMAVPFPVILDTGHSHSLSIRERHVVEWGGLRPEALPRVGHIREQDNRIPLRSANIWVHPNERGERERLADRSPHLVEAENGIAVYPTGDFPRLPILGLRAIAENNLVLKVDGRRREATLRTPIRWWPFS
ncbi:MAG: hypothetical protein JWO38_8131 [Gemmataceae bacterium]|nr:hypothetical protein [Gemmataceae bacterium]